MGVREAAVLLLGKLEPKDLADRIGIACMRSPRRPPFPTGKCLRAELDWARTKFALVVLTEMKSIDLTPLLNT